MRIQKDRDSQRVLAWDRFALSPMLLAMRDHARALFDPDVPKWAGR